MPMIALLLAGGAGTRLWPSSTEARPKQFLRLFGERSLFQLTVARLRAAGCDEIVVLTNENLRHHVAGDLENLGFGLPHLILEPARRDSAPAIAAGVAFVRDRWGGDAVVAIMPSDHLIRAQAAFAASLRAAAEVAASGNLVTFGIRPTFASTGYGYIERGGTLPGQADAFAVEKFHEKPAADIAAAYVRDGYFWNSGMFLFTAAAFEREAAVHMPDIWQSAQQAVVAGLSEARALRLAPESFNAARKTSIDFALFEHSRRVAMVPAAFDWSDVGDWAAVYDVLDKDAQGNATIGDVRLLDCSGTLAVGEGVPLALSGLMDMIVVSAAAGSFAAPRARAADIKPLMGG